MADPLSCVANITAILGFTTHSCHYLFEFFTKIVDAPTEIRHHILWLRALQSTFSELQVLVGDGRLRNIFMHLPPGFDSRLRGACSDLQEVEQRVRRIAGRLKKGGMIQTWARFKYAFSGDQWLKKFLERLQTYQAIFTLDLLTLQM